MRAFFLVLFTQKQSGGNLTCQNVVFGEFAKSRSRVRCGALNSLAEQVRIMQELRT